MRRLLGGTAAGAADDDDADADEIVRCRGWMAGAAAAGCSLAAPAIRRAQI